MSASPAVPGPVASTDAALPPIPLARPCGRGTTPIAALGVTNIVQARHELPPVLLLCYKGKGQWHPEHPEWACQKQTSVGKDTLDIKRMSDAIQLEEGILVLGSIFPSKNSFLECGWVLKKVLFWRNLTLGEGRGSLLHLCVHVPVDTLHPYLRAITCSLAQGTAPCARGR